MGVLWVSVVRRLHRPVPVVRHQGMPGGLKSRGGRRLDSWWLGSVSLADLASCRVFVASGGRVRPRLVSGLRHVSHRRAIAHTSHRCVATPLRAAAVCGHISIPNWRLAPHSGPLGRCVFQRRWRGPTPRSRRIPLGLGSTSLGQLGLVGNASGRGGVRLSSGRARMEARAEITTERQLAQRAPCRPEGWETGMVVSTIATPTGSPPATTSPEPLGPPQHPNQTCRSGGVTAHRIANA